MKLFIVLTLLGGAVCFPSDQEEQVGPDVSPLDITYYFYNLQNVNDPVIVQSNNTDAVKQSHFDGSKQTLILIHGYWDTYRGNLIQNCKNNLLVTAKRNDINIIGVDWSPIWRNFNSSEFSKNGLQAGKYVGAFLKVMAEKHGLNYSTTSVAGHSAGGPISASLGATLKGAINYIIGLDTWGITKADARYVEYIHTTSAPKGVGTGHADWYPNGGAQQPGCTTTDFGCNHARSVAYYVESMLSNKFIGKCCDTYENFKAGKCNINPSVVMGTVNLDTIGSGNCFLETNDHSPFAKG